MDYEQLYQQMQGLEKDLKDKLQSVQKSLKSLGKGSEAGDLKSISKELAQMSNFVKDLDSLVTGYIGLTEGFNAGEYMANGDFARQMTAYCEKLSVDIKGSYPSYEMFPHKIKIDSENQDLYIDRKRIQSVRPQYFVKLIKQSQDKLNKASFNVNSFLNELAQAYDTLLMHKEKSGKTGKAGQDVMTKDLYNYLVPMQRSRREYDMQGFAFDLARLYNSDAELTRDGRSFEFGTSRNIGRHIRILDKDGKEQYLGTIRFFKR